MSNQAYLEEAYSDVLFEKKLKPLRQMMLQRIRDTYTLETLAKRAVLLP